MMSCNLIAGISQSPVQVCRPVDCANVPAWMINTQIHATCVNRLTDCVMHYGRCRFEIVAGSACWLSREQSRQYDVCIVLFVFISTADYDEIGKMK